MSVSSTPPAHDGAAAPSAGQASPHHPQPQHPTQQHPAQPQYPAPQYPAQQYPAQQYGAGSYGYYPGGPVGYPRNELAVWSLVLGLVSLVLGCMYVTGIPAIILGNRAKRAAEAGEADNPGLATAGIVLGWISVVLGVLLTVALVVVFGMAAAFVQGLRDAF